MTKLRHTEETLIPATTLLGLQLQISNDDLDHENPIDSLLDQHGVDRAELASALEAIHDVVGGTTDLHQFGTGFILGFCFGLNAETVAKGAEA